MRCTHTDCAAGATVAATALLGLASTAGVDAYAATGSHSTAATHAARSTVRSVDSSQNHCKQPATQQHPHTSERDQNRASTFKSMARQRAGPGFTQPLPRRHGTTARHIH